MNTFEYISENIRKILYLFLASSLFLALIIFLNKQTQKQIPVIVSSVETFTYDSALAKLDERINSLVKRAEQMPELWTASESAAMAYLERAKLTGNYEDYAAAENLIQQAFAISGSIGGPHLTRAKLNYSLHRLEAIAFDLDIVEKSLLLSTKRHAEVIGLRADVAFQQGEYEAAFDGYQKALALTPNAGNFFRLAIYYWKTGNLTLAYNFISEAVQLTKEFEPQVKAFFYLQQGLLDLDKKHYDKALKHYEEADQVFSGWWLIEEHIAEVYRLKGQIDEALEIYERVVLETENPEYMDALALIALDNGNEELAKFWSNRARARYQEQLTKFPEASYGHALQHYLTFGSAEETLALAKKNYALRPNGEAQIYLIEAYLKAGQLQDAEKVLNDVLESPWRTAYLHEVAAKVYAARGKYNEANQHWNYAA